MKPAKFDYYAPTTLPEAVRLLAEHGDEAKLLAGGQSLVPLMNLRLAQPGVLIDLNRVDGLSYVRAMDDGRLAIGAMTRHHEVATSPLVRERCPLLADAAARIGFPAIRHRGTLGGSLSHADPVSEMPCVAVTLDAELVAAGPTGDRTIRALDFFETYFTSALAPDEVLREIRYPAMGPGQGWAFHESVRKTGDFAIVAVAAHLHLAGGRVAAARIGIAGVADRPIRATRAEQSLIDALRPGSVDETAAVAAADLDEPPTDIHASADFRRRIVQVLVRRALEDAMAMAERSA